jgi:hypothetical protein
LAGEISEPNNEQYIKLICKLNNLNKQNIAVQIINVEIISLKVDNVITNIFFYLSWLKVICIAPTNSIKLNILPISNSEKLKDSTDVATFLK